MIVPSIPKCRRSIAYGTFLQSSHEHFDTRQARRSRSGVRIEARFRWISFGQKLIVCRRRQMTSRIVIIQGHPDPTERHLLHAMADTYAESATAAGHEVRSIEVAKLDFPLLRTQKDFETGEIPSALVQSRDDMRWAEHWLFLFPLWHGTMPALLKGFLEHIFRPGFPMEYKNDAFPK